MTPSECTFTYFEANYNIKKPNFFGKKIENHLQSLSGTIDTKVALITLKISALIKINKRGQKIVKVSLLRGQYLRVKNKKAQTAVCIQC